MRTVGSGSQMSERNKNLFLFPSECRFPQSLSATKRLVSCSLRPPFASPPLACYALSNHNKNGGKIMGKVFYPPNILEYNEGIIFLAGPIQGDDLWQNEAINIIHQIDDKIQIACPRRPLMNKKDFNPTEYAQQVDGETHYLRKAGKSGVIMFWLAKEFEHIPHRAYAQTTRFELAEWKIRHERDDAKLVLGIEAGFGNERYIRRRFGQDCLDIIIYNSLQETCRQTVKLFYV